ncbi:MAG: glycosyltransferase family 2 protein [Microgenomates group bacterium]
MENISAVIVVKNNPSFLFKTLDSINDLVDEVIIVDIGINKNIINQLKKYQKVKIVPIKESVPYVEIIREKTKMFAKNDYVFFLDPDEVVSSDLKKIIKDNLLSFDYFKIPRKNFIFGRWIKHSRWWPDYQIRVFKKNKVFWPNKIHQQPKVSGRGFEIEAKEEYALIHYNYQNLDEYLDKSLRYAKNEAKEIFGEKKVLTFSETVKKALNEFISRYFAAEGYKDGIQGLILAFLQMFYYFLVYFYYLEMKKFETNEKIDEGEFFKQGLKEVIHWKKEKNIKEKIIKKIL